MSTISRRGFLQRASIGIAAIGGVVTLPKVTRAAERPEVAGMAESQAGRAAAANTVAEPVGAYVRDRSRGEVALFIGTREVVFRDPELVARLTRAGA